MAVDIQIRAETTPPVEKIGLPPLNNVLVNVYLNPEAAGRNEKNGTDLVPVQCGSLKSAAYLFEPQVAITVSTSDLSIRRGGVFQNAQREGGEIEKKRSDPETILPGATDPQIIPYWRNCTDESRLAKNFEPNQIVDIMRPQSDEIDRLGLLLRLRLVSATYNDLLSRLDQGFEVPANALDALKLERSRLKDQLRELRLKLMGALTTAAGVRVIDDQTNQQMELSVHSGRGELQRHITAENGDQVMTLMDKQAEYLRLQALLGKKD